MRRLEGFNFELHGANRQSIAGRKASVGKWLAIESGIGGPGASHSPFASPQNQTMHGTNAASSQSQGATGGRTDGALRSGQVNDFTVTRGANDAETENARGMPLDQAGGVLPSNDHDSSPINWSEGEGGESLPRKKPGNPGALTREHSEEV